MHSSPEHAVAIKQNIASFAELLTRLGAPSLSLTYEGYGDSGNIEECGIDWPEGVEGEVPTSVTLVTVRADYQGNAPRYTTISQELPFDQACDALLDLVLDQHGHSGFENGSGGGGELTLTADGSLTVEHYDVVEMREEDTITYAAPPKPLPPIRPSPEIEARDEGTFKVTF